MGVRENPEVWAKDGPRGAHPLRLVRSHIDGGPASVVKVLLSENIYFTNVRPCGTAQRKT
jgi:hypothetical protein